MKDQENTLKKIILENCPHYEPEFKKKFLGEGEWVDEPDHIQLNHKGYNLFILRQILREPCAPETYFGGHFCGYVQIPKDHPLFGKDFQSNEEYCIDCHGGITFNQVAGDIHLIGFDCAHSNDVVPSMQKNYKKIQEDILKEVPQFENCRIFNKKYRNLQYCKDQCISIIEQLVELNV